MPVSPELIEGRVAHNPLVVQRAHQQRILRDFTIVLALYQYLWWQTPSLYLAHRIWPAAPTSATLTLDSWLSLLQSLAGGIRRAILAAMGGS